MCEGWDKSSFSAVKNQIDEALSNIVYDTNPGKTPAKWDFAEYFLFENKRDFVYILPQQATLLYRMCGYQSIYVEGLVVPASAFKEKKTELMRRRLTEQWDMHGVKYMMRKQESGSQWNIRRHLQETRCRSGCGKTKERKQF